jgi:hypothetical protein
MADGEVLGSNLEFIVLVRPGTSAATKIQLLSLCFVSFVASALDFAPEPALGSVDKRCAAPSSRGKKFTIRSQAVDAVSEGWSLLLLTRRDVLYDVMFDDQADRTT